jgi:GAF domain-containing protein
MDVRFLDTRSDFESRWRLLKAARERLAAATTLEAIMEIVRSGARAIVSADGVTFVLREGDNCHYAEEDAIGPLWKGQRFPLSACISGWAMLNDKTAVIEDIYADARIPHDAYRRTFVQSLIMTPVRTKSPVAAIGAYWSDRREFGPQHVAVIESLADAVGEALGVALAA